MKETKIICGFPGIGKTHFFENNTEYSVIDSDSSKFSKEKDFPENYINHIKSNIGKVDIILVSTHAVVRNALVKHDIKFTLIYPQSEELFYYKLRFRNRGDTEEFVDFIAENWFGFIWDLQDQKGCKHIVLQQDQFLDEVINY